MRKQILLNRFVLSEILSNIMFHFSICCECYLEMMYITGFGVPETKPEFNIMNIIY